MCATYASEKDLEKIERFYGARQLPHPYNFFFKAEMFPSYSGVFVFNKDGEYTYTSGFWGLQYRFKKTSEVSNKYATHNAKSETVDEKVTFKNPWKDGFRCVIPLRYFVEWRGEQGAKQKLAIRPRDEELFTVAGLYETTDMNSFSFTMLTCAPNEQMSKIHHRMPVILTDWRTWLDPKTTPEEAKVMCIPYPGQLQASGIK